MKTGNFPGKRNTRRLKAMNRLRMDHPEYKILIGQITSPFIARGIRTKKDRRDRAKFGRNK